MKQSRKASSSEANQSEVVFAVDPGKTGGIVCCAGGFVSALAFGDDHATRAFILAHNRGTEHSVAYMERVGGFIGKEQPGSRMFTFGEAFGFMRGMFLAFDIPLHLVEPKAWLGSVAAGTLGMEYGERKKALVALAQHWYPELKVTKATADALGILRHATSRPSSVAIPHRSEYKEDAKQAEAWAKDNGWPIPQKNGKEYLKMVSHWRLNIKKP